MYNILGRERGESDTVLISSE